MESLSLIFLTILILVIPKFRRLYFVNDLTIEKKEVKKRIVFFDFLKGVAIIAVVFIHVSHFYYYYPPLNGDNQLFVFLTNNIARFAISIFFISSGILLTPVYGKEKLKSFFTRKLSRIFIPYLIMTVGVALFFQQSLAVFIYNLISGQASIPYYFIIILLQFYIIYPILIHFKNEKYFLPLTFFISLLTFLIPWTYYFYDIPLFFRFLFLFCYGIYARDKFLNYKRNFNELLFWLLIVFIYFIFNFINPEIYYNTRLFYGLAVFNILFYFKDYLASKKIFYKLIISFGKNSLWVYLIHFYILSFIYSVFLNFNLNYYFNFFIVFIISLVVSYFISYLVKLLYNYLTSKVLNIKTTKLNA